MFGKYDNIKRMLWSNTWKNVVDSAIDSLEILIQTNKIISGKSISIWAPKLQEFIKYGNDLLLFKDQNYLKKAGLREFNTGLNQFISTTVAKDARGEYSTFDMILKGADVDDIEISQFKQRLSTNIKTSFTNIEEGEREKFSLKSILNNPITSLFGQGVSSVAPAIMSSAFGAYAPIASVFGKEAYNLYDKFSQGRYNKEVGKFGSNLASSVTGTEGVQSLSSTGGLSAVTGAGGSDLYTFFNKGAMKAQWTLRVLRALEGGKFGGLFNGINGIWDGLKTWLMGTALGKIITASMPLICSIIPTLLSTLLASGIVFLAVKAYRDLLDKTISNYQPSMSPRNDVTIADALINNGMKPNEAVRESARIMAEHETGSSFQKFMIYGDPVMLIAKLANTIGSGIDKMVQIQQENSKILKASQDKTVVQVKEMTKQSNNPLADSITRSLIGAK